MLNSSNSDLYMQSLAVQNNLKRVITYMIDFYNMLILKATYTQTQVFSGSLTVNKHRNCLGSKCIKIRSFFYIIKCFLFRVLIVSDYRK